MNILLQDRDALQLIAAQLTREQAGLRLAPVCKDWWKFVRAADAAGDAGARELWREGLAPYHLERVLARITRFCDDEMWYGLDEQPRESLMALAAFIDQLHDNGVVNFVFDRPLATKGKKQPSLLGCHRLEVLEPYTFRCDLHRWVAERQKKEELKNRGWPELEGFEDPSEGIVDLLRRLGLKRRRVTRAQTRRKVFFPADKRVPKNDLLWHRAYVV
jgi:hypothetical protein